MNGNSKSTQEEVKLLLCYNPPVAVYTDYTGKEQDHLPYEDLSESGFTAEIDTAVALLKEHFSEVETFPVTSDITALTERLFTQRPDIILNFVESLEGRASFESNVAALYELFEIEFTGNTPVPLANCLNKSFTKRLLSAHGVATPKFFVHRAEDKNLPEPGGVTYPLICKLLKEDASIGISERSVVYNFEALCKQVEFLQSSFQQDILAEEYITGREFNVAVLDGVALPLSEISFEGLNEALPKIVTYEGKWIAESEYYHHTTPVCPAQVTPELEQAIKQTALQAYTVMECRDYARVDIRLSDDGTPYVIEVNPNPDISRDSGFARAAKAAGMDYGEFLYRIVSLPLRRKQENTLTVNGAVL